MGTILIVLVLTLFLTAIFTGGYNKNFLNRVRHTKVWDWITTVDHKKIGIMYFLSGILYFVIGGIEAIFIRIQLTAPGNDIFTGDIFNQLITMHGTTMIFLAAMPLIFGLMNVIVPLQIGARDVAFPFLNSFGFWVFTLGSIIVNLGWFFGGSPNAGWTSYVGLALTDFNPGPGIDYYTLGLQITGIGSIITGLNFLVTIINMRAPGMSFLRMPMFTWVTFVTSALLLFAMPPFAVALLLLMFDRVFGAAFFDFAMGGSAVIWQHLFWIFGHPEVYIVILPAFGIMSEIISTFSRKRLFGYTSMVFATVVIAFLGFMVWVHHMFTVGLGPMANSIFAVATMLIAVPTGMKVFNWLLTLWGGEIRFTVPMIWAISFIPTFVIGGMTGVMVASPPGDFQYQDSYFVVGHFHYTLVGGVVFALFAGAYYWWPKMFGKMLSEKLGKWHFWPFFIGFHLTFFPQHFMGLFGMPRRIFTYNEGMGLETLNLISSIGVIGMTVGTLFFAIAMVQSFMSKELAPADPWDGRTLEWSIPSPAPYYNFAQTPLVRDYDCWWVEKQAGNKSMPAAEPLGPIHMPSNSHLPLLMAIGLFIGGLGFIAKAPPIQILGIAFTFIVMFVRSFEQDFGYHIKPEEFLGSGKDKGVKA